MNFKTQAIKKFLEGQPLKVNLYTPEMEVQVNTIAGTEVVSKKPLIWSNGTDCWGPFRVPHSSKDTPHYKDTLQEWDLSKYVQAIGLTGWDWFNRCSRWVGFDFDSISNHAKGLSDAELDILRDRVAEIPWVTVRRSKSGKGLHLYVMLKEHIGTANHTEHAALARAILSQLSSLLDFNFAGKVDTSGGVLWIWHREATESARSFEVLKQGIPLEQIPDWTQFIGTRARSKVPSRVSDDPNALEELVTRFKTTKLDDTHRALLTWFAKQACLWWWDAERNMLVCHTADLARAHKELGLRGIFHTLSVGKDTPNDQNCFAFPRGNGSWSIRRHSKGASEHSYWSTDSAGWTTCTYGQYPSLETGARIAGGVKTKSGDYQFASLREALDALRHLGINITADKGYQSRQTTVGVSSRTGDIVLNFKKNEGDEKPEGFYDAKSKWEITATAPEQEMLEPPDHLLRHVVGSGTSQWYLLSRGTWIPKDKGDVADALKSLGYRSADIPNFFGNSIFTHWELVKEPFQPEYPGERKWNRDAPQFSINPVSGTHPTWDLVLNHIGDNLPVLENEWCLTNNITTGGDYLKIWLSSMLRYPYEPLPYLFLWGEQDSGKSIFHEAAAILFKHNVGYVRADTALTSASSFNGELDGAVLCVVEELDLGKDQRAANRIKDWVTAKHINIRALHKESFIRPNTTHWVQCANKPSFCPIFPGDTRITVLYVGRPANIIPKRELLKLLTDEAPAFLHTLLNADIPESNSRLNLPVISDNLKEEIAASNQNDLERFLLERCEYAPGYVITCKSFFDIFVGYLGGSRGEWTDNKVLSMLSPTKFPRGRVASMSSIGNMKVGDFSRQLSTNALVRNHEGKLE